jgi:predicted RNase H-like nuclease (RuvC/YqgF family)
MKVLFTIKEYAKLKGLSEIAIRKKVSANYNEIIKIGKDTYIIEDDTVVQKLKQTIKNKTAQARELSLKLKVSEEQNNDKYLQELERQNKKLEKELKQERKYNKKIHRDIFSTLANQKLLN